ncbi:hypothetical protein DSM106972_056480 [Dulcicalothrix desertica PCC 7102]|uniref:Uncharacterized protein n=1 Tax=Dulcicalothrix desertica PCC 7102 TaxID=232991 RepID=A0A3S1IUL9_9CYAN|nr:hypothetical protein [Dulcicalothrix desertica]RUT02728.1 hypothetical protein DSM106972_056480 [Dulcicalothrix desertica PCC 7102]TWH39037.1 hypothetical protein CAL7102_08241 [Dulcicalothrix desertica PCC 7102]
MKNINQVSTETGLSIEEIRMILSETNNHWDSVKELTDAEFEIITKLVNAKRIGATAIEHVVDMPLEHQKAIVLTASEVLEHQIKLSIVERLQYHETIAEVENQAIIHIHNQKKKELAAHFQQEHRNERETLRGILQEVSGLLGDDVKLQADGVAAKDELAVFMQVFKKKLIA